MRRYTILFVLFFASTILFAQTTIPTLPTDGKLASFIPKGWKKGLTVTNDLNGDSLQDVVMLIQKGQEGVLLILNAKQDQIYNRSFVGTFSSIEYVSKLGKRAKSFQITFDLPSYTAGHLINVFVSWRENNWTIIGYSEETYENNDVAAKKKVTKGLFKDVNLITGDVSEYSISGTKKTFKKKYKETKAPLILLKDIDTLPVMNW